MNINKATIKKRLNLLIDSKLQNNKKIIELENQVKILRKKLQIETKK